MPVLLVGLLLLALLSDDPPSADRSKSRKSPEGAAFIGAALRRLKAEGVPEGERIGRALAEARAAGFR